MGSHPAKSIFCPFIGGKWLQNGAKNAIFQNWPKTRPKMINAWNKCLTNHLGGCFAWFLEPVLRFGRSKSHFLSLEKRHFCQTINKFITSQESCRTMSGYPHCRHHLVWSHCPIPYAYISFFMCISSHHKHILYHWCCNQISTSLAMVTIVNMIKN